MKNKFYDELFANPLSPLVWDDYLTVAINIRPDCKLDVLAGKMVGFQPIVDEIRCIDSDAADLFKECCEMYGERHLENDDPWAAIRMWEPYLVSDFLCRFEHRKKPRVVVGRVLKP